MKNILITGVAGFIGMHVSKKFLENGYVVYGIDNINDYYDVELKNARLDNLKKNFKNFKFSKIDICDFESLKNIFDLTEVDYVIHLAAQAGVRYSIIKPYSYIEANIKGFLNILEVIKEKQIKHFIYASSSSVYGNNIDETYYEESNTDQPLAIYGVTKKSNELMAHSYSYLYNIPTTGLRFFTVYGPWGRPDMALFIFTKSILENKQISIFNNGNMIRDFTYIDDITESIYRLLLKPPLEYNFQNTKKNHKPFVPYNIFNIGNSSPRILLDYVYILEKNLNLKAKKKFLPIQKGDVISTKSSTKKLYNWIEFKPNTPIELGVKNFVEWYKNFYLDS